ncbi:MAG: hypothetical protein Q9210_006128, partial [Variospora velana]
EHTPPLSLSFTDPAQPRLIPPSPLPAKQEYTQPLSLSLTDPAQPRPIPPSPLPAKQEYTQPLSLSFTDPAQPRSIPPSPLSPEREHTPPHTYLKVDNQWASDQPQSSAEATGSVTDASNPGNGLTSPTDEISPATGASTPGNQFTSPAVELKSEEVVALTADHSSCPIESPDDPQAVLKQCKEEVVALTADHSSCPIESPDDPQAVLKQCKEELLKEARTWNAFPEKTLKSYMYFDAVHDRRALRVPSPENIEKEWQRMEQLAAKRSGRATESMRVYGAFHLKDLNTLRFWVNLNQHILARGPHRFPPGYNPRFADVGGDMSMASTVFSESEKGRDD